MVVVIAFVVAVVVVLLVVVIAIAAATTVGVLAAEILTALTHFPSSPVRRERSTKRKEEDCTELWLVMGQRQSWLILLSAVCLYLTVGKGRDNSVCWLAA